MGCGCRKRASVEKSIRNIKTNLAVKIEKRYLTCSKCSKSVPIVRQVVNTNKRKKIRKKCKKLNIDISIVSSNFNYKCPLNKF